MNVIFPSIRHLSDLQPFVEANKQIRIKPDASTGLIVVSYQVQDEDTFTGEHEAFERECRGITFHADGKIAARTLHKFFNVGQRDDVQPEKIDWSKVTRIMDKRDGSMVTPVTINSAGEWLMKTKKTFTSKEAKLATQVALDTEGGSRWIVKLLAWGLTPTFEITSPKFPIVLQYSKDELTLLHVRENVTGRYLSEDEVRALNSPFPLVQNLLAEFLDEQGVVSWEKLKAEALVREKIEGWVIQFDQEMIKLKTEWYCELHRSVTFTRWRDIARTVLSDSSDDLKGSFTLLGRDIEPILLVERAVKAVIDKARDEVDFHVVNGHALHLTPKDMALAHKDHPMFGQIMSTFRGKEIDWMQWYERNHLDSWSLEVVGDEEEEEVA